MRIVCFGDSNTYGYDPLSYFGSRYQPEDRWVDILGEKLGCQILNEGENGRSVPGRAWEITQFHQTAASWTGVDLVIIMLGTNDLLQDRPVEETADHMERFLQCIDFPILLVSPPPMKLGEWVPSKRYIEANEKLASSYKALSERLGVDFVDTGKWNISLAFDGVHFTPEGHRAFAEELYHHIGKGE